MRRIQIETLSYLSLLICALCWGGSISIVWGQDEATDPAQLAKDTRTVETLLRLKTVDPNTNPKLSDAVLRYLKSVEGTPRYLEVVEALDFKAAAPGLVELAIATTDEAFATQALRLLFRMKAGNELIGKFSERATEEQVKIARALGGIGNRRQSENLAGWIVNEELHQSVRSAAINGLVRSATGRELFLQLLENDLLPEQLRVSAATAVAQSTDRQFVGRVGDKLPLPESADATPLPPLSELVATRGDAALGKRVFNDKGTCANCHVVGGQGKEVGPNLSEIGSKLARDAMFLSILDPNAGVSHNYETYLVETIDGEVVTGILLSKTDEVVTVKTAEAVIRNLPMDDVEIVEKQKVSLMPEGLQKNMTADELVGLVEYLLTLKKAEEP